MISGLLVASTFGQCFCPYLCFEIIPRPIQMISGDQIKWTLLFFKKFVFVCTVRCLISTANTLPHPQIHPSQSIHPNPSIPIKSIHATIAPGCYICLIFMSCLWLVVGVTLQLLFLYCVFSNVLLDH